MHLLSLASLKNRALIALITFCVAIFGGVALQSLRIQLTPDLELPAVAVTTTLQGASPEIVNADLTTPIERALQVVPALEGTTGTSSTGVSTVLAEFAYGTNIPSTEQRVQQALNRIQSQLPQEAETTVFTGSLSDIPVLRVAVTDAGGEAALVDALETITVPQLERVDGVRSVQLQGAPGQRILISPDDEKLALEGLTRVDISDTIDQSGELLPGGTVDDGEQTLSVQIGDRLGSVENVASLPLNGDTTIGDIAEVRITEDPASSVALVNGERSVILSITKTQAANTVEVSRAVSELLPALQSELGEGAVFTTVFDQAPYVEKSMEALAVEGVLGLVFAVLVILVFLLSIRSTIVTAISIPVSVLMTFIGMWGSGFSLNVFTLGALTISIGRVVDDSIVVIENIKRHLAFAGSRATAIVGAVREVAGAITASTATTVIVFLPLAFVSDITGELFRPFALTVTIALAASLVVALTIVPVLAYWFLRQPSTERGRAEAAPALNTEPAALPATAPPTDRPDRLRRAYRPILTATLRRPVAVLMSAIVLLGVSVAGAFPFLAFDFLGDDGDTSVQLTQELQAGASLETQLRAAEDVSSSLREIDAIETVSATVSSGAASTFGPGGTLGTGGISYAVVARDGTDMPALRGEIRAVTEKAAGETTVGQAGGFGGGDIEVQVQAPTEDALEAATDDVAAAMGELEGIAQVTDSLEGAQPLVEVAVDRQLAAERGLTETEVSGLVAAAMQPSPVGQIQLDGAFITMYLDAIAPAATLDELRELELPTGEGPLPLADVAEITEVLGPTSIATSDGNRTATVTVTPGGVDVGGASGRVQQALAATELGDGASAQVGGVATQISDGFTQLGIAALVAVLLVYVVMVATFKSLLQPFLLLVSVPFAATGAIVLQLISGLAVTVASMVGVLMLVGIVVTNAIVLIDLVNQYRDRGLGVREALIEGGERRLRPILMTAAATIFALLPLATGLTGQGGFISQPLAIVVIGGLVSSTILTLLVLPVLYLLVEGSRERRRVRRGGVTRAERRAELESAQVGAGMH